MKHSTIMGFSSAEWLDQQADRLLTAQGARAETAKLIVTFSVGISVALLGAALQEGFEPDLWWSIGVFGLAALLAALTFLVGDQLVQPDHGAVLEDRSLVDDAALVVELRRAAFDAVRLNESWVGAIKTLSATQLMVSFVTWGLLIAWLVANARA